MSNEGDALWSGAEPLQAFFDEAPCGLMSCTGDGTILAVNDTFLTWTGYERSALQGACCFDELLTLPSRMYYETHYWPLMNIQGYVHEVALDVRRRDGSVMPTLVSAKAKRNVVGGSELLRFVIVAAEDRRAYERELLLERRNAEQAVKAKADFLAMFAHEIRNPLCAVMLATDLISDASARSMREPLERTIRLLNNMLDVSKLDAGKVTLQKTEFEIEDVVRAVVHSLSPLAAARSLPLTMHVDPKLRRPVLGDPMKLDQALTNLVGNAIKFTEKGSVKVGAELITPPGNPLRVRFGVVDTGIGIPASRQTHIFEEYEQADASIGHRFGGSGLGLAITRKLVALQGGQLDLVSEPGRGSTFMFDLEFTPA